MPYNAVHRKHGAPPSPTRSTVCSRLAHKGLRIAIAAMAVAGASPSAVVATKDSRAVRSI